MNKADLLKVLTDEYKQSVRLPNDISVSDYRDTIERETGVRMSYTRAVRTLNASKEFVSLLVIDRGKITRVWREKQKGKNVKSRNTHKSKPQGARRVSKKHSRSEVSRTISV